MKTLYSLLVVVSVISLLLTGSSTITESVGSYQTIITITQSQIDEIERLGTLTINEEQYKLLREIGKIVPKRVLVITADRTEVSSDAPVIGTQIKKDKVSFPNAGLQMSISQYLNDTEGRKSLIFRIDPRGQFYLDGILIPFDDLVKYFVSMKNVKLKHYFDSKQITIVLPLDINYNSPTVNSRLEVIKKVVTDNKWSFEATKDCCYSNIF